MHVVPAAHDPHEHEEVRHNDSPNRVVSEDKHAARHAGCGDALDILSEVLDGEVILGHGFRHVRFRKDCTSLFVGLVSRHIEKFRSVPHSLRLALCSLPGRE